ncbi:MAG TPA: hypothetical protein VGF18_03625, partial [Candidatus Tumulicola sp.]
MRRRAALVVFASVCGACEFALLLFDRPMAYLAASAFAYNGLLWIIASKSIRLDLESENRTIKTTARGWRLGARLFVVAGICLTVIFGRRWLWSSPLNAAVQHLWSRLGFSMGDSAPFNFILLALVPGILLFALGATRAELGLTRWRPAIVKTLLSALILPGVFATIWFAHGRGTLLLLLTLLVHNFLSNGFSEEFLLRGIV